MKISEVTLAKIAGAVFVDALTPLSREEIRHEWAENILAGLRTHARSKGTICGLDSKVGEDRIVISRTDDEHNREYRVGEQGIEFYVTKVKDFRYKYAPEIAESLRIILEVTKRTAWNRLGIMFGLAIPALKSRELDLAAIGCLRGRLLAERLGELEKMVTIGKTSRIDLTLKSELEGREVELNVYNTCRQDIVVTFDVKSSENDALNGDISKFLVTAYELFVTMCDSFLEVLTLDQEFGPTIDVGFLQTG